MRRYFSEIVTSARGIISFSVATRLRALLEQERHVERDELLERVEHLLHQRQDLARGRLDLAELALNQGDLVGLRLHLRPQLRVEARQAVDVGERLAIARRRIVGLVVQLADAFLRGGGLAIGCGLRLDDGVERLRPGPRRRGQWHHGKEREGDGPRA